MEQSRYRTPEESEEIQGLRNRIGKFAIGLGNRIMNGNDTPRNSGDRMTIEEDNSVNETISATREQSDYRPAGRLSRKKRVVAEKQKARQIRLLEKLSGLDEVKPPFKTRLGTYAAVDDFVQPPTPTVKRIHARAQRSRLNQGAASAEHDRAPEQVLLRTLGRSVRMGSSTNSDN